MARDNIPVVNWWWWLRSPGYNQPYAAIVDDDGSLNLSDVNSVSGCVRPALKIRNLESSNLETHDRFQLSGHMWTIVLVDEDYCIALCDESVGYSCFREDWRAEDANVYEASDIKKWLDQWAKENGVCVDA